MKRFFLFAALWAALFWSRSSAFAAENDPVLADPTAKGLVTFVFSSEKLQEAIDEKLDGVQMVAIGVGFLLLVFPSALGLIRSGLGPESIARYITRPILLCAFIATVPEIQGVMSAASDSLAAAMGYDVAGSINQIYGETNPFDLKGAPSALRSDTSVMTESVIQDKMGSTLLSLRDLCRWFVQGVISVPAALALNVLSYVIMTSVVVADFLRHAFLAAGYTLLPVFIAGLNSERFKGSAYRYTMRLMSVHVWPLIWSIVGAVSLVGLHLIRIYVDNLFATAAVDPSGDFALVDLIALCPTVVVLGLTLSTAVVAGWQVYGTAKGAALLSRLVAEGGELAEGYLMGTQPSNSPSSIASSLPGLGHGAPILVSATVVSEAQATAALPTGSSPGIMRSARSVAAISDVMSEAGERALVSARAGRFG